MTGNNARVFINAVVIPIDDETCDYFVFRAGKRLFGVPAAKVAGIAERKVPAPLPFAPPAVLGVVGFQSRMVTVIDPLALIGELRSKPGAAIQLVTVLNGDEQLGLAGDSQEEILTLRLNGIPRTGRSQSPAVAVSIQHHDREIMVLDPASLFAAAIGRIERRRRRS